MAEKIPKSRTEKVETKEKPEGGITTAILTPDDKTEGFEETGYGSAPGSSDVMSGAESSIWTSDDHASEESKPQRISKATASGSLDISTKPACVTKKPTSRKPKLGFFKKASPVRKIVESTGELTENLIPQEEEHKTKSSPRKTKSRSKFTSGLPKLVSLSRNTSKSQSYSPVKKGKDSKTSPKKSPVRKLSGIPLPVKNSPKTESLVVLLANEEHTHSKEKGMTVEIQKPTKSISSSSKSKYSVQALSDESNPSEFPSQAAESGKAGECSVKPKRAPKFSLGKSKPTKQVETSRSHSSSTESKTDAPSATFTELVRKGIKKMDVSGKLKKSIKNPEETCLIEKDTEAAKTKTKHGGDESSEDRSLNEPYVYKETSWKPVNSAQKGGFLLEDMIAYVSSSEKDTTPTEMSTLSDSSGLIRGKSKSQRSRHTLSSLSKFPSFEEEAESPAKLEGDIRPQLQRQTNVPDLEEEGDSGDVFDSPICEVKKQSEDETKE